MNGDKLMWWGFGVGSAVLLVIVNLVFGKLDKLDTRVRDIEQLCAKRSEVLAEHTEMDKLFANVYGRLRELEKEVAQK